MGDLSGRGFLGSQMKPTGPAAAAGWSLSGSVLGCLFIGYVVGDYFDANPAAIVIGLFVGVAAGFYTLAKTMWLKK